MVLSVFIYAFIIVFLLNVIPIFGPPTWLVLSFISFNYPISSLPLFVLVTLTASTLGRIILTLSAKHIIRNRFLGEKYRKNMENLRKRLEKRPYAVAIIFFLEAFTPLPSDQFFIAYGLTGMKLRYAIVPFFVARLFTYSFWVYAASEVSKGIAANSLLNFSFLSWSFLLGELLLLIFIYFFVKLDWQRLILEHKVKIL
jgi:membrane protein YqaA with SNARE-associated domain